MKVLSYLALLTLATHLALGDEILIEPLPPPTERTGELFVGPKKAVRLRLNDANHKLIQVDLYETNNSLVLVFSENQNNVVSWLKQHVTIDHTVTTKQTITVWISKSVSNPLYSLLVAD